MPSMTSGGAAFLDFNDDGRLDIYLLQHGGPGSGSKNRLFQQLQDGTFKDVSRGSGLDFDGWCQGVAVGDVNNDGLIDLCVTEYRRTRLLMNRGSGKFQDVSKAAGIDNDLWAVSAAFADFDRDGWLDLVVVNYVEYNANKRCSSNTGQRQWCGPSSFVPVVTRLFRNRTKGRAGQSVALRFEDATVQSGLAARPQPGLGVACADFNGDRWCDILIANDGKPNSLWINQKNGTFKESGVELGIAYNNAGEAEANMGIGIGDVDGDTRLDVFVTHLMEESHRLWKGTRSGTFEDRTAQAKLTAGAARSTGFGTLLADFDNDGDLDLSIVTGAVRRPSNIREVQGPRFWKPYLQRNQLFANDGAGTFVSVDGSNPDFCDKPDVARGLACGDVDNDGRMDLLVTVLDGNVRLYKNVCKNQNRWLRIRAYDRKLNRDAYGAEVTIKSGNRRWKRWMNPSYSYVCSNDHRAHFGLGTTKKIDEIDIIWPDGRREKYPGTEELNREILLLKGEGSPVE